MKGRVRGQYQGQGEGRAARFEGRGASVGQTGGPEQQPRGRGAGRAQRREGDEQGGTLLVAPVGVGQWRGSRPIVDGENTGGGQGEAMDLSAQGMEHSFRALHRRFTLDDPGGGPDRRGQVQIGALLVHQGPAPTAEHFREGLDRHEGRLASRPPRLVVRRDPTGRHQAVPVGMVGEGPAPGVPHTPDPDQAADVVRVRRQRDERLSRRTD
jgi:hypothetical protein